MSGSPAQHIWIVEDDLACQDIVCEALTPRWLVTRFNTLAQFEDALRRPYIRRPALVIADVYLTDANFMSWLVGGRARKLLLDVPILIVSSADDVETIRAAFAGGAIDFLSKPFGRALLMVKVERALGVASSVSSSEGIVIDAKRMSVRAGGITVGLTSKEMQIMSVLWTAPGRAVNRRELREGVWPDCHVGKKTLDVHLSRLRTKLEGLAIDFESRGDRVMLRYEEQLGVARPLPPPSRMVSSDDGLVIDPKRKTVSAKGIRIGLTAKQLAIVSLLWNAPEKALSREELRDGVWPGRSIGMQILAVQLTRLKRKLRRLDVEFEACGERVVLHYAEGRNDGKGAAEEESATGFTIDAERMAVSAGGVVVELSAKQLQIVSLLWGAPGHALTRDELIEGVWPGGTSTVAKKTLAVQLSRLRRKLNVLNVDLSSRDDRLVSFHCAE